MKTGKLFLPILFILVCGILLIEACEMHRSAAPAYGDGGGSGEYRPYRSSVFKTRETGTTTGWSYDGTSDGGVRIVRTEDGEIKAHSTTSQPKAKSGLLTATEISDFAKWDLWGDYVKDELLNHQKTWKINPYSRYLVQLENESGKPLQGAIVTLLNSKNDILWQSVSDNTGKAQLWASFSKSKTDSIVTSISITYKDISESISSPLSFEKGVNHKKIKTECKTTNVVDIAFVVDATGSMGDEIEYLKEEVNDIIGKVKTKYEKLTMNTASVFYRDKTDAYLTIHSDFSSDIGNTTAFIKKQSAGGGGDFPEAVDAGLEVAVNKLKWNDESRAKLIFIFLDAPPHTEKAEEMQKVIFSAAQKGIKIIPVFSSGSDKSNQFIMRSAALATNATSVFITNHSGIGGNHEEPVIDRYDVELLNDVLQRVIEQNIYMQDCNEQQNVSSEIAPDTLLTDNSNDLMNIIFDSIMTVSETDSALMAMLLPYTSYHSVSELEKAKPISNLDTAKLFSDFKFETTFLKIYPNPTNGMIKAEFNTSTDWLYVTDMSGKMLSRISVNNQRLIDIDLTSFPSGIYFVQFMHNSKWISAKVVLNK